MKALRTKISGVAILLIFILFVGCGEDEQMEPEGQMDEQPAVQQTQPDTAKVDTMKAEPKEESTNVEDMNESNTSSVPETYEVKEGETLASIAYKFYDDSTMWFEIFAANENDINNWNKIYPGQELVMVQKNENDGM